MIEITDKTECCGCQACGDVCPTDAISFPRNHEGFWYPRVDLGKCIDCHLCERVCPSLTIAKLKRNDFAEPKVYGGHCRDITVRFDSTSGGVFSVLAQAVYKAGGSVGGAVYTDDFRVVNHISSDKRDLRRLRSSKYVESDAEGLYRKTKALLDGGGRVLVCGSPCQMAGLRGFLRKDYANLVVVDFLCRAANSPKVFEKYKQGLEARFGSRIVAIKDKNKDHGWHSLARKVEFENGQVYYGEGHEDDYRRGYHLNVYERPSCYNCKFKGFPRISDISLGDFWGIENVDRGMASELGTSLVMVNSRRGEEFFNLVRDKLVVKPFALGDILPGNTPAIVGGKLKQHGGAETREAFFRELDTLPFDQLAEKYFPYKKQEGPTARQKLKNLLRLFWRSRTPMGVFRLLRHNVFRRGVRASLLRGAALVVRPRCAIDIARGAIVSVGGLVLLNESRTRGSRGEFRLLVERGARLSFGEGTSYFKNDSDIQIFRGATMEIGSVKTNMGLKVVCSERITIGRDVHIGRDVWIRDNNGGHHVVVKGYKDKAPVEIGDHAWICSNVVITKGVTIGEGAIVSAGSFVSTNVPAHSIAQGNPAQVVAEGVYWL